MMSTLEVQIAIFVILASIGWAASKYERIEAFIFKLGIIISASALVLVLINIIALWLLKSWGG